MPHGEPEQEALLDKLYEEFVLESSGYAREIFKAKVRAYHAIQLGKMLVKSGMSQEAVNEEIASFLRRRG